LSNNNNVKTVEYFSYIISDLETIDLESIKINLIESNAFLNCRILVKLSLANNYLRNISQNTFLYLFSLKYLNLSHNQIHFINEPESYYLGSKYVVVEIPDDGVWFEQIRYKIAVSFLLAFIFMMILGYFILRLFLKPMRDALHLLDRFIKDTTHELNTPVTAIITNIEMIDKSSLDERLLLMM
jgi:signal transduction histidine kinase